MQPTNVQKRKEMTVLERNKYKKVSAWHGLPVKAHYVNPDFDDTNENLWFIYEDI